MIRFQSRKHIWLCVAAFPLILIIVITGIPTLLAIAGLRALSRIEYDV